MSSSYDPDRLTKSELEAQLRTLKSDLKHEASIRTTDLALGIFVLVNLIGFWVMAIVSIATDAKEKAGR